MRFSRQMRKMPTGSCHEMMATLNEVAAVEATHDVRHHRPNVSSSAPQQFITSMQSSPQSSFRYSNHLHRRGIPRTSKNHGMVMDRPFEESGRESTEVALGFFLSMEKAIEFGRQLWNFGNIKLGNMNEGTNDKHPKRIEIACAEQLHPCPGRTTSFK